MKNTYLSKGITVVESQSTQWTDIYTQTIFNQQKTLQKQNGNKFEQTFHKEETQLAHKREKVLNALGPGKWKFKFQWETTTPPRTQNHDNVSTSVNFKY